MTDSRFQEQTLTPLCHPTKEHAKLAFHRKEAYMWLGIAAVLLIAWLVGFIGFHVAAGAFHILLGLFVIAIILHFVTGRARV